MVQTEGTWSRVAGMLSMGLAALWLGLGAGLAVTGRFGTSLGVDYLGGREAASRWVATGQL